MHELDQSKPETLVNQPSPDIPKWFTDKLIEVGGRQLDGRPNLRTVWGQSETRFACGRHRIKYPTSFSFERAEYQFRLVSVDTGQATQCNYEEFMNAKKAYDAVDPNIKFIPEFKVKRRVEWIGIPRIIIEQYKPVVLLKDTPSGWESNRYGWWFNPETRRNEWTDITGPFPYNGRYEHFLTVQEDNGTNFGLYKAPAEDTLLIIREALQKRESHKALPAEIEVKNIIEAENKKREKAEADLADEIANSLAPHINKMYEQKVKFYNT